jgi:hypothetical protein
MIILIFNIEKFWALNRKDSLQKNLKYLNIII